MDEEGLGRDDGDLERTKFCPLDPLLKIKAPLGLGHLFNLQVGKDLPYIPPTK